MRVRIEWLWIVGFVGMNVAANAQTPSPLTAGAAFDGTYGLVSSAKLNETYVSRGGTTGYCPGRTPGALTITQNRAQYTAETGLQVEGTIGANGQLTMRSVGPGPTRPVEVQVSGSVDRSGAVRVRQRGNSCSYDFVWQKRS